MGMLEKGIWVVTFAILLNDEVNSMQDSGERSKDINPRSPCMVAGLEFQVSPTRLSLCCQGRIFVGES